MQTFGIKKISIDLDGPNTSTSSMETMHAEITHALKYVNALPRGRLPQKGNQKFGWAFGHLGEECLPQGAELTSWRGEGAYLGDGSPQGMEGTSWWGKGGVSLEGWSPPRSGRNLLAGRRLVS
jgi:hypothetical protein